MPKCEVQSLSHNVQPARIKSMSQNIHKRKFFALKSIKLRTAAQLSVCRGLNKIVVTFTQISDGRNFFRMAELDLDVIFILFVVHFQLLLLCVESVQGNL